ncbi:MAG: YifB family Mg chelatase-like AAA ATPase [Proteobacteria bacterium]|nr:YifB family Mg chelatase-like AAA ATPase [Pseudomonadota bacterium]MBU1593990.1 YifB family Mg chelatase-like AAA ATPase [Pseudomonadota bacterium]
MIAKARTAALLGIDALPVSLEVDLTRSGMPAFTLVGLAEGAVREAKERVLSALKNAGYRLPPARITVNLAPADLRKEGSAYDLPLALCLLAASEGLDAGLLAPDDNATGAGGWFLAGELSLDGALKPVPGILPLAILARDQGAAGLIVSADNAAEAAVVQGLAVYGADSLSQAVRILTGEDAPAPAVVDVDALWAGQAGFEGDFAEVKGQEHAKRAIEIAAAGGHNLLFVGPPGSGKTMLSQRIPTVLPPLTFDEALEVTKIYSVAGMLDRDSALVVRRPFRSPHHTISDAGLIGGGVSPRPGEVSLAHRGVLFLDELPEFKKHVLEVLRQPLEDGRVTISRAAQSLTYPSDFMLVAAMNPCPCGYLTDDRHVCSCQPLAIHRYRSRISGPLMDRIDLQVEVPAVPYEDLKAPRGSRDSATMRAGIVKVRAIQAGRYKGSGIRLNADLQGALLERWCKVGEAEHGFLEQAVRRLGLSARAYTRVLRIARTIADMEDAENVGIPHLAEAINFRTMDRVNQPGE